MEQTIAVPRLEEQKHEHYRHNIQNVLKSSAPMKTSHAQIEQTPKQVATLPLSVSPLAVADRCASISTGKGIPEAFTRCDQLCLTEKLVTAGKKLSAGLKSKLTGDTCLSNERKFVGKKAINFTLKIPPRAADLTAKPVDPFGPVSLLKPLSSITPSHKISESEMQSPIRNELCSENNAVRAPLTNTLSSTSDKVRSVPGTTKEARNFENSTWKTQWVFSQLPSICRSNKVLPFVQLAHAKTLRLHVPERQTSFTAGRFSGGRSLPCRPIRPITGSTIQQGSGKSLLAPVSTSRSSDQKKPISFFVSLNGHRVSRSVDAETAKELSKHYQPQYASSDTLKLSGDFCHFPSLAAMHVMERSGRSLSRSRSSDQLNNDRSYVCLNRLLKYADDLQVGISPSRSIKFPNVRFVPAFIRECSKFINGQCAHGRSTSILESALPLQRLEKRISEELLNIKHIEQAYHKIQEDKLVQRSVRRFLDFVDVPTLDRLARGERFRKFQDWTAFLKGILRLLHEADAGLLSELERDRNSVRNFFSRYFWSCRFAFSAAFQVATIRRQETTVFITFRTVVRHHRILKYAKTLVGQSRPLERRNPLSKELKILAYVRPPYHHDMRNVLKSGTSMKTSDVQVEETPGICLGVSVDQLCKFFEDSSSFQYDQLVMPRIAFSF